MIQVTPYASYFSITLNGHQYRHIDNQAWLTLDPQEPQEHPKFDSIVISLLPLINSPTQLMTTNKAMAPKSYGATDPQSSRATRPQSHRATEPKGNKPQNHRVTELQSHKATESPRHRAKEPRNHRAVEPQNHKTT